MTIIDYNFVEFGRCSLLSKGWDARARHSAWFVTILNEQTEDTIGFACNGIPTETKTSVVLRCPLCLEKAFMFCIVLISLVPEHNVASNLPLNQQGAHENAHISRRTETLFVVTQAIK